MGTCRVLILGALFGLAMPAQAVGADSGPLATTEAFVTALSRADLEGVMGLFAVDATMFAPSPGIPMRIAGKANIRRLFEPMLDRVRQSGDGPVYMNIVPRELKIQDMGDTAIVTFHLGQVPDEPREQAYSFSRRTLVLHRTAGLWRIVHLHASSVIIPGTTG